MNKNIKDADCYSVGPDWFREGIEKAKEEFVYCKRNIVERYAFKDPNNGKVLLIDSAIYLIKGSDKKYTEEMSYARKEYDREIDRLKKRLLDEK